MCKDDSPSCSCKDCMNSFLTSYHYSDLSLHKKKYSINFVSMSSKFDGISSLTYNKIPPPNVSRSNLQDS